ncbi:transglutaminase domain-containing protein [Archangium lansingense]|uniref:Transglutaminase-like domain-containing protein n=1 Tax=Archangium lansingense TaxID=2995310 RepID=A0ABT4AAB5_9BACT|nr:transglutaminase domain-containing protein [Archangium lansinium]MCY1078597.1 hypothetical protein [Archangium lansinium]
MQVSVREQPRRANGFVQGMSMLVMAAMVCLSLKPLSAAAAARPNTGVLPVVVGSLPPVQSRAPVSAVTTADDQYGQALEDLKELVSAKPGQRQSVSGAAGLSTSGAQRRVQSISEKIQQLEKLDAAVDASFAEVGKRLDDKKLSKEIKARHQAAELAFKQKRKEMKRILEKFKAADAAGDEAKRARSLEELGKFLAANQPGKRHKKLDPNKLPWRVSDGKARKPAKSPEAFARSLAGSDSTSRTVLAPATSGDLSATDDVQITQAVTDLAISLGKNPVTIYNWVRNNIDYIPSFGSIQGSDATLSKKQGNAFDTASLLIALYRASGIPARYVYGTIQVPADAAMNWVGGGVTKPEAAQQLWAQGGVPNVALTNAGRITHIELEHVWVEAWVDFAPSRGQKQHQGDTWVPLDASFKQYTFKEGFVTTANIPINGSALESAVLTGAVVNEAEGWIQNPNVAAIQSAGETYVSDLNNYVQQSKPNATNGDVFGSHSIIKDHAAILAASLPYKAIAVGARYSDLPSALTQKFRYKIYANDLDRSTDSPMLSFEESLPNLAGRKVTLSYVAASNADLAFVASLLPSPHADGSQPSAEDYAALRYPAYLIRLKPEVRVDGVVRATGAPVTMGTELLSIGGFTGLDLSSGWDETSDALIAGQATAIGLNIHGIDKQQLGKLKARIEATKAKIDGGNFNDLAGEFLGGDLMTLTIWSYFAAIDYSGSTTRATSRIIDLPALSFGLAHADVDVVHSFGIARSAKPSGILLDIGHLRYIRWSMDGDRNAWVRYNRAMGEIASTMEHVVPEHLFVGPQTPGEAISAVKLLTKAVAAGQRIYTITRANLDAVLPQLTLRPETLDEVRSAVATGKEVTVHQSPVEVNGWSGTGYIVIDPETGAGGYMIEGGANGGKLLAWFGGFLIGLFHGLVLTAIINEFIILAAALGPAAAASAIISLGWPLIALAAVMAIGLASFIYASSFTTDFDTMSCFTGGFSTGFGIGLAKANVRVLVQRLIGFITGSVVVGNAWVWQCRD